MRTEKPGWRAIYAGGLSVEQAAAIMGCSRRTAAAELTALQRRETDTAFRYRHAPAVARVEARPGTESSNWPVELQELALRIAREGEAAVAHERAALAAALPRAISVKR